MPGDWNLPTVTSLYTAFVTELTARDVDALTMCVSAPTHIPANAMRFNRSTNIFEEYLASVWTAKVLGITGGGTGGTDAASGRAALGIGTLGVQDSNSINVTGGALSGITVSLSGNLSFGTHNAYDVGSYANQARKMYVASAFVFPVGVDKYATS